MEAFRHNQGRKSLDQCWQVVRGWAAHELREPAKLVWNHLYEVAGGVECSVKVHAGALGRAIGTGERPARRGLESLAAVGLILIPDRFNGEISVYLNDPLRVAIARLSPGESSGQGELQFPNEPESPPEVPKAPEVLPLSKGATEGVFIAPDTTRTPTNKEAARKGAADRVHEPPKGINTMLNTNTNTPNASMRAHFSSENARATEASCPSAVRVHDPPLTPELERLRAKMTPAEYQEILRVRRQQLQIKDPGPADLSEALGAKFETLPTAAQKADAAHKLALWISAKVADSALQMRPLLRIAHAVLDGLLPMQKVHDVLRRLEANEGRGLLKGPRGKYFNGSMRNIFVKLEIPWTEAQP